MAKTTAAIGVPKIAEKAALMPTHNEDAAVTVIKPEPPSKLVSDASAELQCGSLTSRRTTEKMGDHGRDKDERCHFKRQFGSA